MKELILKLLSELQPYEYLIGVSRYTELVLIREDSILPYAVRMTPIDRRDYMRPTSNDIQREESWCNDKHIQFKGQDFVIDLEITDIKYEDDYVVITRNSCYEPCIIYLPYSEISFIKKNTDTNDEVLSYNKFQWELNHLNNK
jgi:hypothetical protein